MNVGGVAVLINNLLSGIDSEEYEVLLVTGVCEYPESEFLDGIQASYTVITIPSFRKSLSLKGDLKAFLELRRIIKEFQPDIVHTHTSKAGLLGRITALVSAPRAKRIHTFHGHLLIGYFSPIKLSIIKMVERILGKVSTALVAMGTQVKDDLVNAGIAPNSKFRVFFPGIIKPNFPTREKAREQLKLDVNSIYCIFIGRLTQVKRPDRVLEIARNLKDLESPVKMLIVGDGELSTNLKEVSERDQLSVQFLGWRSDIAVLLAASDLLLLTSDNEAVALTLIEASLAGIPVVTTAAGSVQDIAIDGFNGFVTDFNVDELTAAIVQLAESSELRKRMGVNGVVRATEFFSVEKMVTAHQELYKELLRL
jgi:glycosyltransferase involved in cell wall biosynthesis